MGTVAQGAMSTATASMLVFPAPGAGCPIHRLQASQRVQYANDEVTPEERHALAQAGRVLYITKEQIEAIDAKVVAQRLAQALIPFAVGRARHLQQIGRSGEVHAGRLEPAHVSRRVKDGHRACARAQGGVEGSQAAGQTQWIDQPGAAGRGDLDQGRRRHRSAARLARLDVERQRAGLAYRRRAGGQRIRGIDEEPRAGRRLRQQKTRCRFRHGTPQAQSAAPCSVLRYCLIIII